jgi:hypothetical protein
MSLSRKHYCAVAAIIADAEDSIKGEDDISRGRWLANEHMAAQLADYFASDNPQFDRARFLAACKVAS